MNMNGIEQSIYLYKLSIVSFVFIHITPASSPYPVPQKPTHYQVLDGTVSCNCPDFPPLLILVTDLAVKIAENDNKHQQSKFCK